MEEVLAQRKDLNVLVLGCPMSRQTSADYL